MKDKTIGWLFKIPLILMLIGAFIIAIYAAVKKISGIGYGAPTLLLVIIVLYAIGEYFHSKRDTYW